MDTVKNLNLLKSEDADKIMKLDKQEIIQYYEGLLNKCHELILHKRDQVK